MGPTSRITLLQGDITREKVDAIVNAANKELMGGGGVDGAIRRAGGPEIDADCEQYRRSQNGCPTGGAVPTVAGKLSARYVFHSVGPIWFDHPPDACDRLLASAYRTCMELAQRLDCRSIAFPSISTGVYGFPIERAAPIALSTVATFPTSIDVRFVLFAPRDLAVYEEALSRVRS